MTPAELLNRALVGLASRGQRPRCGDWSDHDRWTSDSEEERAQAATWCAGCPVFTPCGDAAEANDERFGVWAGVDRTRRTRPTPARSPRQEQHQRATPPNPGGDG